MKQKVMKIGSSLGVTVPADFIKAIGIKQGDEVEVKKKIETGEMIYKFSGVQQLSINSGFLRKKRKKRK